MKNVSFSSYHITNSNELKVITVMVTSWDTKAQSQNRTHFTTNIEVDGVCQ